MSATEKGCEAIVGSCFWTEFWKSYEPIANFLAHDGLRNLALIAAAIVTLFVAIERLKIADEDKKTSIKQAAISEAGLNIDRFRNGAAMLGDVRLSVRQAGILMLSELAQQNMDEYFDTTQKIICSFVKDRSQEQRAEFESKNNPMVEYVIFDEPISQDNQTAMEELSKLNRLYWSERQFEKNQPKLKISIPDANLRKANFIKMDLRFIDFSGADFTGACLYEADLTGCKLNRARLFEAKLRGSIFRNVDLLWSEFTEPGHEDFWMTDLTSQQLESARFVSREFLENVRAYEDFEEEEEAAKSEDKNTHT